MKKLIIVVLAFFMLACKKNEIKYDEHSVTIKNRHGEIETIPLEKYVIGVVAGEMPAIFHEEALKVQAIIARTYAHYRKGKVLDVTDLNQVYIDEEEMRSKWGIFFLAYYNKINDVVYETENKVITYNGKTIDALYFAISNGYTENSEDVFTNKYPYLRSVETKVDLLSDKVEHTKSFSKEEFFEKLGINKFNFEVKERSTGNGVKKVVIGDKLFDGNYIRSALRLRSTDFSIIMAKAQEIEVTTYGYGHRVGLSQWGSQLMAADGKDFSAIISHYYQDIKIFEI